jgi:hypothetical protein
LFAEALNSSGTKVNVDHMATKGLSNHQHCYHSLKSRKSLIFTRIRKNVKKQILASSCLSVCLFVHPHGTTLIALDGFSLKFIFEDFSKIC